MKLVFTITQHSKDEKLIKKIEEYFEGGNTYNYKTRSAVDFQISKINDLIDKIIPFFDKYKIVGIKSQDFEDFKKIAFLIKNGSHLTVEGVNHIFNIQSGMNTGRVLSNSSMSESLSTSDLSSAISSSLPILTVDAGNETESKTEAKTKTKSSENEIKEIQPSALTLTSQHKKNFLSLCPRALLPRRGRPGGGKVKRSFSTTPLTFTSFGSDRGVNKFKKTHADYTKLKKISEHVPLHKSNLNDEDFGYFLAGLIEGDGWFGAKELHIIFSEGDVSLAYLLKKRVGFGTFVQPKKLNTVSGVNLILKRQLSSLVPKISNPSRLSPFWVTGFSDGESCFQLAIIPNSKFRLGYQVRFNFSIWLKKEDKILLEEIKAFFCALAPVPSTKLCEGPQQVVHRKAQGVGKVYKAGSEGFIYSVNSIKDLEVVIRHFESYPLISEKWSDYHLFKQALEKVKKKEHLTPDGLVKLVEIKASINLGLNSKLKTFFQDKSILPVLRPKIKNKEIPAPE